MNRAIIWVLWCLATVAGHVASVFLLSYVFYLSMPSGDPRSAIGFFVWVVASAGGGVTLGLAQYGVLRLSKIYTSGKWVLATAYGYVLPLAIVYIGSYWSGREPSRAYPFLIIVCLSIGIAQWPLLRRRFRRSAAWIPANGLAAIINALLPSAWKTDGIQVFLWTAALTGFLLLYLSRLRVPELADPAPNSLLEPLRLRPSGSAQGRLK